MELLLKFCVLLLSVFSPVHCYPGLRSEISTDLLHHHESRSGKFIPMIFILPYDKTCKFEEIDGLCMNNEAECKKRDGRVNKGKCSRGLFPGVCCQTMSSCTTNGGTVEIKRNETRIKVPSPGIPSRTCNYKIPRQKNICQLRVDFRDFAMSTSQNGNCYDSKMTIEGDDDLGKLVLCGDLDPGTHIYLNYGTQDSITISTEFPKMSKSRFEIQISLIECSSSYRAPSGCTQHYTAEMDEVKSFNFPKQQLNNQQYSVCVKAAPGKKKITWKPCPTKDGVRQFFISGLPDLMMPTTVKSRITDTGKYAGIIRTNNKNKIFSMEEDDEEERKRSSRQISIPTEDAMNISSSSSRMRQLPTTRGKPEETGELEGSEHCKGDYILINGQNRRTTFCGRYFKGVSSTAKPFSLFVHFDGTEEGYDGVTETDAGGLRNLEQFQTSTCPRGTFLTSGVCMNVNHLPGHGLRQTFPSTSTPLPPGTNPPLFVPPPLPPKHPHNDMGNTGFCLRYSVT